MSRFLPLVILVIWLSSPSVPALGGLDPLAGVAIFLGFYLVMAAVLAIWSRRVARMAHFSNIQRRVRTFNLVIYACRILIPGWLAVGVFVLGWRGLIFSLLEQTSIGRLPLDLPGILLGCLPPFAAWMGLWWAQFPADRALREQNILIQLDQNLPLQPPPSFRTYFFVNLRLQLLFTIAPAILLLFLHDSLTLILPPIFHHFGVLNNREDLIEAIITLPSFALFLVFSPEILRRVLHTESMPDCPLRRKLTMIARQNRVGFRDVLLWKTESQMGNAAVMGFVPRFRYVLLSDLLLETMHDEQIEAIFAHELGHVIHRHLYWLVIAMATLFLAGAGPGQMIADEMQLLLSHAWSSELVQAAMILGVAIGVFVLVFGYVSRKFERQADVFAARTMQNAFDAAIEPARENPAGIKSAANTAVLDQPGLRLVASPRGYVGQHGADVFCSALERVAVVNNIPIAARSWCHGSIARRMRFLEYLARDAQRTTQYDRFMFRFYIGLIVTLCVFAGWLAIFLKAWPT